MILRPFKSTIVIGFFILLNGLVGWGAWSHRGKEDWGQDSDAILSEVPSEMKELQYFHLDQGQPSLSLAADSMRSLGEQMASFERPRGTYASGDQQEAMTYQATQAEYVKSRGSLRMMGNVELDQVGSKYRAAELVYYHRKDQLYGKGGVNMEHFMAKTGETITIKAASMKARPKQKWALFRGQVDGVVKPRLKFQSSLFLKSEEMELQGLKGVIGLKENVFFQRGGMKVTARNGDVFLEQANKKLKYFILNDDVKVTENLLDANGKPMVRQAFAERMEGFGQDKIVLSGAPRVLQGKDVMKGYRITMREKLEFIEIEDAMSDVQVKKDENKKKEN